MELQTIFLLTGLGFTLAAPLGPVNAEMIKKSLAHSSGWIYGLIIGIGAMTGDFIIAMTALFLGAEVLSNLISIFIINIILLTSNVLILSYIGISSLRNKVEIIDNEEIGDNFSYFKQYRLGFILVVTSPWSYGFWATFGPVMLNSGIPLETFALRFQATVFFLLGILLWLLLFNSLLKISHKFSSPKFLKVITNGSAFILILFALKIFLDIICLLLNICLFS